jgi:hypothetical protein
LALSDLVLSLHLIPEVGSGEDDVLSEDSDSEAGWFRGGFTRKLSSDNPVLLDLYAYKIKFRDLSHLERIQWKYKSDLLTSLTYF